MINNSAEIRNIPFKDLQPYIDCIAEPMVVKDIQHRWVMVNDAFCSFTGYSKEKLLGKTDHDFFPLNQAEWFHEKDRKVFDTGAEVGTEEVITDASGVTHTIYTKKRLFVDQNKEKFIVCIIFDITDRKQWERRISHLNEELEDRVKKRTAELAFTNQKLYEDINRRELVERALRLSESRLEALLELNQRLFDSEHEMIMFAIEEAAKLTGSRVGYLAFVNEKEGTIELYEGAGPDYIQTITSEYGRKLKINQAKLWGEACRLKKPVFQNECHNDPFMVEFAKKYVEISRHMHVPIIDNDEVVIMAGVANKETFYDESDARQLTLLMDGLWKNIQKRRAEQALCREKELLSITMRSIGEGMISIDKSGRIVLINETAEKLTGYTAQEAVGKPIRKVYISKDDPEREELSHSVKKVLQDDEELSVDSQAVLISKSAREYNVQQRITQIRDSKGEVVGAVVIFGDITEKKKLEEKLTNTEKLKSLGVLAGGIAHDFNNLLTGIFGNIELSIDKAQNNSGEEVVAILRDTLGVLDRARDLTQQLLTFSKGGAPVVAAASIAELLQKSARFVLSGSNITYSIQADEKLRLCRVDQNQIGQVFDNLLINAKQAMTEGGRIEMRAENILVTEKEPSIMKTGNYIRITIKDEGPGIAADFIPRIFDPFFTTKRSGTGLGLAIVYSIINKHNGYIDVESTQGEGTTFLIHLPAGGAKITRKNKSGSKTPPKQHRGRILLLDDEEFIRRTAKLILARFGYEVTLASRGEEVLKHYEEASDCTPFDLIILDLSIAGGMGGRETLEKVLNIDHDVKAIASSGYFNDPVMAYPQRYGFRDVLRKPYTISELEMVLEKVNSSNS